MKLSQLLTTALLTISATTLFAAESSPQTLATIQSTTEIKTTTQEPTQVMSSQNKNLDQTHVSKEHTTQPVIIERDAIEKTLEEKEEAKKKS